TRWPQACRTCAPRPTAPPLACVPDVVEQVAARTSGCSSRRSRARSQRQSTHVSCTRNRAVQPRPATATRGIALRPRERKPPPHGPPRPPASTAPQIPPSAYIHMSSRLAAWLGGGFLVPV